ncbi:anthocyanidin 3-O-glucosyltransferase 2-like [Cynara cardunculus var. scolymus]|uniref:Glycosyltransferase n=1 Tax=Cynara cardunculus var. scolymus TaxID=59895 RepID=A0A103XIE0_CYNCS|nr:anthocyanidin 3-O-glucosyltransferase 2-like [Cynara cardunculus var. scolymus]KVH91366.1 UDP-glucuronosyl/UDP-glucosyltransferase [Cynara cardunculus var. scolymus]
MANSRVPELVFIPAPGVGHIMSTIEMAKLLVNRDQTIAITVLLIHPPYSSSVLTTYIRSLSTNPIERIRFIKLPPDQEAASKLDLKAPFTSFYGFINSHRSYVRNVVIDMMSLPGSGRIAGFVVDILCTGMIDVANEFGIPTYAFFTSNAAFLGFKLYIDTLLRDHKQEDIIEWSKSDGEFRIPSFIKPVPMMAYPVVYQTRDGLDFLTISIQKFREVKAIMVNTFLELETHAMESFSSYADFPPVYAVGPVLNLDGVAGKAEDKDVIRWLDGQPPSSVVFLCFGSMGSFEEVQLKEIAYALERSGNRFVWSLRRPPPSEQSFKALPDDYDDPRSILPDGFLERTNGFGRVIGWAPQVALLAHEAVGGFVSHCGWNSMLESLWFGVPTGTWPMYTEQQMNAFEMVVELGLAVDIKLGYKDNVFHREGDTVVVKAEEIESGIRRLMADEEVRAKVKRMSKMSRVTVVEGGSSYASVGRLIQDFVA